MKLLHIGLDAHKTPDTSLMKVFKRHCSKYRDINTGNPGINKAIIDFAQSFQPDFVFMQIQTPGVVSPKALQALRDCGAFVCNWTGDCRTPLPVWYITTGSMIDLTLFTNYDDVVTARAMGVNADFCPIGYDPDIYHPDYNQRKDIEVAFFANHYPNTFPLSGYRKDVALYLKGYYREKFKLFGNGWSHADGNFNHSQPEESKVLQRVKIAVNVSHFAYRGYASDRLNRTLGCGAICLTHEFPEMHRLGLEDNVNCVVFRDLNDLSNKIDYYLENEGARKRIADAGHKLATEQLTFDKMIENLLSFYKQKVAV